MSKDKNQSKRLYKGRGANTKRKKKQGSASGKKRSKSGSSLVVYCPECGKIATPIAVTAETREVTCKAGHTFPVGASSYLNLYIPPSPEEIC